MKAEEATVDPTWRKAKEILSELEVAQVRVKQNAAEDGVLHQREASTSAKG
jgi:hypothetical protein